MRSILKVILRNWRYGLRGIIGIYLIFVGIGLVVGFDIGIPFLSSLPGM